MVIKEIKCKTSSFNLDQNQMVSHMEHTILKLREKKAAMQLLIANSQIDDPIDILSNQVEKQKNEPTEEQWN